MSSSTTERSPTLSSSSTGTDSRSSSGNTSYTSPDSIEERSPFDLPTDSHPFAYLNELGQRGLVQYLTYRDLGSAEDNSWRASIALARQEKLHHVETVAHSKKLAKIKAAEAILAELRNGQTLNPPPTSPPRTPLATTIQPSPELPVITKNQSRVLAAAEVQRTILKGWSTLRGLHSGHVTFVALDVEKYEHGSEILEVGLALIHAGDIWPAPRIQAVHLVVTDHLHLTNGTFVVNNRANFSRGASQPVALADLAGRVADVLDQVGSSLYIVGHSVGGDLKWLRGVGIDLEGRAVEVCDLAGVGKAQQQTHQTPSLASLARAYGIATHALHNAGNDAYYTLELALAMMAWEGERMAGTDYGI